MADEHDPKQEAANAARDEVAAADVEPVNAAPTMEVPPVETAPGAGDTAHYETDALAAGAGEHVPDPDAELEESGESSDEEDEEVEYVDETVVVVRRPVFIAMVAVPILLIVALAAAFVYEVTRPAPAVASVNGSTVSRKDYDQAVARDNGQTVLNDLVTSRLVQQDANKKHMSVTTDEVDAKLKETKAQFPSDTAYQQALDQNHLTELQLRDRIRLNLMLQKLTANQSQVSDQEIQQEYDQNKDTTYQGKSLDDVKAQITQQLMQQKQSDATQGYVKQLCAGAKITTHMPGGSTGHGCPSG